MKYWTVGLAALAVLLGVGWADAAIFFGPIHYVSAADIPPGFYAGGSPIALEDFEDGSLDFGITGSPGGVIPPGWEGAIDSVDADDGVIDGSGLDGHSWFYLGGSAGVKFTFPSPVTAAGIVWTDGAGTTTFEAFGPGDVSLGTIGPVSIAGLGYDGDTASDHFFGVQDWGGITAVKLSNTYGGIEVDHVQFGNAIPEPASLIVWCLLAGLGIAVGCWRRSRNAR